MSSSLERVRQRHRGAQVPAPPPGEAAPAPIVARRWLPRLEETADSRDLARLFVECLAAIPVAGVAGALFGSEQLALYLLVGWIFISIIAITPTEGRRPPRFFVAMVGGDVYGDRGHDSVADVPATARRRGELGPREDEILRFLERMRGMTEMDWHRVLHPTRTLRGAWIQDGRARWAYERAERALAATARDSKRAAALATLVRDEFRRITATMDMNAPSHAHAAALAILVRDRIPGPVFRWLYAPFQPVIPFEEIGRV